MEYTTSQVEGFMKLMKDYGVVKLELVDVKIERPLQFTMPNLPEISKVEVTDDDILEDPYKGL